MIWRVVMAGLDTLSNVKKRWTLDDLLDAHEALDQKEDLEAAAMLKARQGHAS